MKVYYLNVPNSIKSYIDFFNNARQCWSSYIKSMCKEEKKNPFLVKVYKVNTAGSEIIFNSQEVIKESCIFRTVKKMQNIIVKENFPGAFIVSGLNFTTTSVEDALLKILNERDIISITTNHGVFELKSFELDDVHKFIVRDKINEVTECKEQEKKNTKRSRRTKSTDLLGKLPSDL